MVIPNSGKEASVEQKVNSRRIVSEAVKVALRALPEGMVVRPDPSNPYAATVELAVGKRYRLVVKEID